MTSIDTRIVEIRSILRPHTDDNGLCLVYDSDLERIQDEFKTLMEEKISNKHSDLIPWMRKKFGEGNCHWNLHPLDRQNMLFSKEYNTKNRKTHYVYIDLAEHSEDKADIFVTSGLQHNSVINRYHSIWLNNFNVESRHWPILNNMLKQSVKDYPQIRDICWHYGDDRTLWHLKPDQGTHDLSDYFVSSQKIDFGVPGDAQLIYKGRIQSLDNLKDAYKQVQLAAIDLVDAVYRVTDFIAEKCEKKHQDICKLSTLG